MKVKSEIPEISTSKDCCSDKKYIRKIIKSKNVDSIVIDKINISIGEYLPIENIYNNYLQEINHIKSCNNSHLGILNNGDVIVCCMDYLGKCKLGNIYDTDISDILFKNKELIESIRTDINQFSICQKCQGYRTKRHSIACLYIKNQLLEFLRNTFTITNQK